MGSGIDPSTQANVFIRLRRRPSASPRGEPRPWPGRNAALLLRRDVAPWRGGGCLAEARRAKAGNRVPRACPGSSIVGAFHAQVKPRSEGVLGYFQLDTAETQKPA